MKKPHQLLTGRAPKTFAAVAARRSENTKPSRQSATPIGVLLPIVSDDLRVVGFDFVRLSDALQDRIRRMAREAK